jgi:hypothetical protein
VTEQNDFIYEWLYDEDNREYYCIGQVFYMSVINMDDEWLASLWDTAPVGEWGEEDNEMIDAKHFDAVHEAMDWAELRDINEAEYDSSTFKA